MSTSGDVQYIGGYHEYIGGCSVHRGDTISTSGNITSTLGDVQYIEGYHDACGDTMSTSGDDARSPNMVMSRDPRSTFQKFLYLS